MSLLACLVIAEYERSKNESGSSPEKKQIALKILYTPPTLLTRAVVERANRTFETLAQVMALAQQVANCSQFFLKNFPPDSDTMEGLTQVSVQYWCFYHTQHNHHC